MTKALRAARRIGLGTLLFWTLTAAPAPAADSTVAGLDWFTDLEAAKAEAARTGRPIVSLRLLGRLDEELSCANSRYFRLALYPDPAVARRLRKHFVLHWSSERPVPKVSIDFGDGRRLEGTVTGNSIHYLLDARGRVVDALPGLVSPRAFLAWLDGADELARLAPEIDDEALVVRLRQHHRAALAGTIDRLRADLAAIGAPEVETALSRALAPAVELAAPTAAEASARALSKAIAEQPLLEALLRFEDPSSPPSEAPWERLAALPGRRVELDAAVRELAAARADALLAERGDAVERFERSLARDTLRNEVLLRAPLHAWFESAIVPYDLATLNRRVYDTLFLTPADDPWLGLAPTELFAVLAPAPDDSTPR